MKFWETLDSSSACSLRMDWICCSLMDFDVSRRVIWSVQ